MVKKKIREHLLVIALLIVHLLLLVNLRFEAWPEMLLYPWLMNKGYLLYKDIINPYLPGLIWILRILFVTAQPLLTLKIFTWSLILFIDFLVYYLSLKIWRDKKAALFSLGFFIIFQPIFDGNGLWFDLATTPFLLLDFWFLKRKNTFLAGLFLALAFLIKQSVIWFYFLILIFYFKKEEIIKIFAPLFLILGLSAIYFYQKGIFADFFFWTIKFPFTLFPFMPGYKDLPSLRQAVLMFFPYTILLFTKVKLSLFLWTIVSFLFVFPRWALFHLQPSLAFLSILAGGAKRKKGFILIAFYLLLVTLLWLRQIKLFWQRSVRFFEPEIIKAASWIKENTEKRQLLFNLNAPDQLYFLADRLPIKPWAANFPWYLELEGIQEKIIEALKRKKPKLVIFSPYLPGPKFKPGSYRPKKIDTFIFTHYQKKLELSGNIWILERK